MTKELKIKLQQEYDAMYPKFDFVEFFGTIAVGVGFIVLTYLWFTIL